VSGSFAALRVERYAESVFDGVGWGEIVVLLLIGLFVFGPDRLPQGGT
jgi:hypothetical protein